MSLVQAELRHISLLTSLRVHTT